MAVIHIGSAVFIDDDPISPQDWRYKREKKLRKEWNTEVLRAVKWLEDAAERGERVSINPVVEFLTLERADVGVGLMRDGKLGDVINLKTIYYDEPRAPYIDAGMISDVERYMLEETPFVEVRNRSDWEALLEANRKAYGVVDTDDAYAGPGLYDGRDMTKAHDSMEAYEIESLAWEAEQLIDYVFTGGLLRSDLTGEEWVKAFEDIVVAAAEEDDEA